MNVIVFISIISSFYLLITILGILLEFIENHKYSRILRKNSKKLDEINTNKIIKEIQFYKYTITSEINSEKMTLPNQQFNSSISKTIFLSPLYNKFKFKKEKINEVLFK